MPSALSLCRFGLAVCQFIWVYGRWEIGPLKHLTTMLERPHTCRHTWSQRGTVDVTHTIPVATRGSTYLIHMPPPPPPFFHFTCDQAHMWRAVTHLPVMLKSAGFCVMYGNKRGVWARSDTLPPTRHSLNACESQVESCRLAWCVCARMRWCFLIHKTFLCYCVWVLCDLCVSGLTA